MFFSGSICILWLSTSASFLSSHTFTFSQENLFLCWSSRVLKLLIQSFLWGVLMLMDLVLTTPVKMATASMKGHSCFLPLSCWGKFGKDVSMWRQGHNLLMLTRALYLLITNPKFVFQLWKFETLPLSEESVLVHLHIRQAEWARAVLPNNY